MRQVYLCAFTLCCAFAVLFAQPSKVRATTPADTSAAAKTPAIKTPTVEDRGVEKIISGTIVSIDQGKNSITIRLKSGDYAVSIVPNTTMTAKDNTITFSDFKPGDIVYVNYRKFQNGERRADRINNKTFVAKSAPQKQKSQTQQPPVQKSEVKAEPVKAQQAVQAKEVKAQPATQQQPAQTKEVKDEPKSPSEPALKNENKPAEKKDVQPAH